MIIRNLDTYTTSKTSDPINVDPEKGFQVHIFVPPSASQTGAITVSIQGKVPSVTQSGSTLWYTILTSASTTVHESNQTFVNLAVGPQITDATNLAKKAYLPSTVRVVITAGNANPLTYAVVTTP